MFPIDGRFLPRKDKKKKGPKTVGAPPAPKRPILPNINVPMRRAGGAKTLLTQVDFGPRGGVKNTPGFGFNIRMDLSGLQRFSAVIHNNSLLKSIAEVCEQKILTTALALVPVDTSNLMQSIVSGSAEVSPTKVAVEVGVKAEGVLKPATYAIHVEYGTYRTRAQPFLRPAIDLNRDECVRLARERLHAAILEASK